MYIYIYIYGEPRIGAGGEHIYIYIYIYIDGEPFPFQTTSELYPEYGLLAGRHVEWELQREVLTALLKLNKNDTVKKKELQREVLSALFKLNTTICDDIYYGVDLKKDIHLHTIHT